MNWKDIRAKLAGPRHDCQVERQTGRHRAEPEHRWEVTLFFLGATGLLFSLIITAFVVWNNPAPPLRPAQYRPSSPAVIPKPVVFPPWKQETSPARTYTVVSGDSMWSIARKECGNGTRWVDLQHENSNDPWHIEPGQVLKLPAPACA